MSDLKKLLEGLLVEVKGKDEVELDGVTYYKSMVKFAVEDANCSPLVRLAGRVILRLMDEHEEPNPAPTWEPGTVLKSVNDLWIARLDKFISFAQNGDERWAFTVFDSGATGEQYFTRNWTVHRLPHEFKVGDWFECESEGIFQCFRMPQPGVIEATNANLYKSEFCRHVPAPRKEAVAELARQEMADGHYTCEPEAQDPLTGPNWDNLDFQIAELEQHGVGVSVIIKYYELLRQRDLRDEVRRLKEAK